MAHNMENVEETLRIRKKDIQRTDCSVIFAGIFKKIDDSIRYFLELLKKHSSKRSKSETMHIKVYVFSE